MSSIAGYNPNVSLLPNAGGTIQPMSGGAMIEPPTGFNPNASLLPEVGGEISSYKGGSLFDEPITSIGGKPKPIVVNSEPSITSPEPSSIPLQVPTPVNSISTPSITITPPLQPKKPNNDIEPSNTKDTESSGTKDIILFGTNISLENPSGTTTFTDSQILALKQFGLDGPGLSDKEKRDVLQALYDGKCNSDKPLIMLEQCEPIRRIVQSLALNLLSKLTPPDSKAINTIITKEEQPEVKYEKLGDGSMKVSITFKPNQLSLLSKFKYGNTGLKSNKGKTKANDVESKVNNVEPKMNEVEIEANEVESKTNEVEPKTNEVEPKTNNVEPKINEIEIEANEVEPKINDVEPKANLVEPKANEVEPKINDVEPKANVVEPKANEVEPKINDVEPKANLVEPKANEVEIEANEIEPKANDVESKANDVESKVNNTFSNTESNVNDKSDFTKNNNAISIINNKSEKTSNNNSELNEHLQTIINNPEASNSTKNTARRIKEILNKDKANTITSEEEQELLDLVENLDSKNTTIPQQDINEIKTAIEEINKNNSAFVNLSNEIQKRKNSNRLSAQESLTENKEKLNKNKVNKANKNKENENKAFEGVASMFASDNSNFEPLENTSVLEINSLKKSKENKEKELNTLKRNTATKRGWISKNDKNESYKTYSEYGNATKYTRANRTVNSKKRDKLQKEIQNIQNKIKSTSGGKRKTFKKISKKSSLQKKHKSMKKSRK
jgi:hypothetical protein